MYPLMKIIHRRFHHSSLAFLVLLITFFQSLITTINARYNVKICSQQQQVSMSVCFVLTTMTRTSRRWRMVFLITILSEKIVRNRLQLSTFAWKTRMRMKEYRRGTHGIRNISSGLLAFWRLLDLLRRVLSLWRRSR